MDFIANFIMASLIFCGANSAFTVMMLWLHEQDLDVPPWLEFLVLDLLGWLLMCHCRNISTPLYGSNSVFKNNCNVMIFKLLNISLY